MKHTPHKNPTTEALTLNQVCEHWLYSKIGYPKGWHRKDSKPSVDIHATVAICAVRVTSTKGYFAIEALLKEFMETGLDKWQDFEKVCEFRDLLEKSLIENPVFAVEAIDEPAKEVKEYRLSELATAFGCSVALAYKFMDESGYSVPGVFKYNKRWRVLDISALKAKFREKHLQKSA